MRRFLPSPQDTFADKLTSPLRPIEERVWVAVEDSFIPYEVPGHLRGLGRAVVVVDRSTNERRYELQDFFQGGRPMLGLTGGEGSKFFAATWCLMSKLQARAAFTRDPGHRRWRDWQLAVDSLGWRPLLLELLIVMNLPFGPWLSEAWFKQVR